MTITDTRNEATVKSKDRETSRGDEEHEEPGTQPLKRVHEKPRLPRDVAEQGFRHIDGGPDEPGKACAQEEIGVVPEDRERERGLAVNRVRASHEQDERDHAEKRTDDHRGELLDRHARQTRHARREG